MAAGVALCCALGGLIGWVCLRMSGPYLAIFTLGFAEIVRITFATEDDITSGMAGLHVERLFDTPSRLPFFYTAFALLAVSLLLMGGIVRSRWGLFLRAIREDEEAARGMRVVTVVRALPGIGAATARRLIATAGIDGGRRVGGLTAGQRERLVAAVDAELAARHSHRVTIPARCPLP